MIKEFRQLGEGAFPGKPVVEPVDYNTITREEFKTAMEAVNLIKEKRGRDVKGRTCANGSNQRKYLRSDESVASPTVSTKGMIGSFVIDAYKEREIGSFDIPGAYLHANMKHDGKRVLLVLRDEFVDMMCEVNDKYKTYVKVINGRKVLYLKVLRALYGCIESALLWYELFTSTLANMGFKVNPYDRCVANKIIGGKQCTVVWYVDDAKVSHADKEVVTNVISEIEKHFGKMDITYGKEHEYLGMKVKITDDKKVLIDMTDQVKEVIEYFGEEIKGSVSTPANRNLLSIDINSTPLDKRRKELFHSVTARGRTLN